MGKVAEEGVLVVDEDALGVDEVGLPLAVEMVIEGAERERIHGTKLLRIWACGEARDVALEFTLGGALGAEFGDDGGDVFFTRQPGIAVK